MPKPELLAPIQDFTSLQAAIQGGADAVYFGIKGFNMRAGAKNFTAADLKKVAKICHNNKIKAYLALNIIIYNSELNKLENILKQAKAANIDAIICWDMAVLQLAKKYKLNIHLSTQASVANSEAVKFYKKLGVSRIILARECSLKDIKTMNKQILLCPGRTKDDIALELEIFIHGAMCVSVSGRCFLSQFNYGKSANRGECLQPCRRKYLIKEIVNFRPALAEVKTFAKGNENTSTKVGMNTSTKVGMNTSTKVGMNTSTKVGENSFEISEDYILSPKDLCTLPFIEKLLKLNIASLKIEGRNRSPEYVKTVTSVYREAIDLYYKNKKALKYKNKQDLLEKLKTVYNRKFSSGFYLGKPINGWSHSYGSQASEKKIHIGKIKHFYKSISVAEIEIQADKKLNINNNILILGPTTGVVKQKISSMEIEHKKIKLAKQGDIVAVKLSKLVRANDEVYKINYSN